jgi:hypothetical protein
MEPGGFDPKGRAAGCLEWPQRLCKTAPKQFGNFPAASVVEVKTDMPALFFSSASGGTSG